MTIRKPWLAKRSAPRIDSAISTGALSSDISDCVPCKACGVKPKMSKMMRMADLASSGPTTYDLRSAMSV